MAQHHRDLILHKRAQRIADDHNCTVDQVNAALDQHPVEIDRDKYLKRALALQLLQLDALEVTLREKALVDHDVAAGALLIKVAERRASLLRLNAPVGHAVQVVQEPPRKETSTEERRVMDELDGKKPEPDDPPATEAVSPEIAG
jgi:hypothetical protein